MKREGNTTTINTVDIPSLDEYMKKVTKNGGKVLTPRMAVPGIGYFAYCQADTRAG